jgi:hypothetical protein
LIKIELYGKNGLFPKVIIDIYKKKVIQQLSLPWKDALITKLLGKKSEVQDHEGMTKINMEAQ